MSNQSQVETVTIHTSVKSAEAIKAVGEVLIAASWNKTSKQEKKERAILLPMECVKAPEVPEAFRALVECALLKTAEGLLKKQQTAQPNSYQMLRADFDRPNLCEAFISSSNAWLSKDELEEGFMASATWARISARPEFKTNASYQRTAMMFKDTILKLAGKTVTLEPEKCDLILSKLEEADLETEAGAFIVRRLSALKERQPSEVFDLDAL